MIFLLAALLVTDPVVSQPYTPAPAGAGTTTKTVALARTDSGAVACWMNQPQVLCAALRAGGGFDQPVALASYTPGAVDAVPAVAWNGKELLVAFEELGQPNSIVLTRLSRDLKPLAPPIRLMYATKEGPAPSLSWNGKSWLLTQRIFATRLTPALDVVQNIIGDNTILEGAASGDRFVYINSPIVHTAPGPCASDVVPAASLGFPLPCPRIPITTTEWTAGLTGFGNVALPVTQQTISANATVASRARGALLVWPVVDAPKSAIVATSLVGTHLGDSYRVATASEPVAPRVAATENTALIVWEERGDIRGVLLNADDYQQGEPFIIAGTAQQERHPSAVALNDNEYAVVYELEGRLATRFVTQAARRRSR